VDLAFDSNHSAVGKNKLVELYREKPESLPPYGHLFQADISHDGYGSQEEGGRERKEPPRGKRIPGLISFTECLVKKPVYFFDGIVQHLGYHLALALFR